MPTSACGWLWPKKNDPPGACAALTMIAGAMATVWPPGDQFSPGRRSISAPGAAPPAQATKLSVVMFGDTWVKTL